MMARVSAQAPLALINLAPTKGDGSKQADRSPLPHSLPETVGQMLASPCTTAIACWESQGNASGAHRRPLALDLW